MLFTQAYTADLQIIIINTHLIVLNYKVFSPSSLFAHRFTRKDWAMNKI